MYISSGKWKNPKNLHSQTILVFGTDPRTTAFKSAQVNRNISELQKPNTVLFDQTSLPIFGPIATLYQQKSNVETELNNIKVRVRGLFDLGASFAAYGNVITSDTTYLHLFPQYSVTKVKLGLVKLKSDADINQVRKSLESSLPKDVKIFTVPAFEDAEKAYWAKTTPIGFVFGFGVIIAFLVGTMVVYQIMYSDVATPFTAICHPQSNGISRSLFSRGINARIINLSDMRLHSSIRSILANIWTLQPS